MRGSNALPGSPVIHGAIHARERPGHKNVLLGRRLRDGAYRFMRKPDHLPASSRIIAAVYTAATGIQRPGARVKPVRISRVHQNVSDDVVLAVADAAQQLPVPALIDRTED